MAVLVRLAKLEEDRALQGLGTALRAQRKLGVSAADADAAVAAAEDGQRLEGRAVAADWAEQAFRHAYFARERAAAARLELARSDEELGRARDALAQAKLRLLAMEKVRDARVRTESKVRQRALDRRLDDAIASEQIRRRERDA